MDDARAPRHAKRRWGRRMAYDREVSRGTGYKSKRNASRLANEEDVKRRINYLMQANAMRKGITIDGLCDDLERDKEHARKIDQSATAIQATLAQAKLMGLLIDRKESGKAGEFAHLSIEELRKQLKEDLEALEAIRARK